MRFGIFYEHQLPKPLERRPRAAALPRTRSIRSNSPTDSDRPRLGGGASLPGGVLALVGAGGLPRRRLAAHPKHPLGARDRPDAARLQPPRPRRRTHLDARPGLQRPRRIRHRRIRQPRRAGGLPRQSRRASRDVARIGRAGRQHDGDEPLPRLRGASTSRCPPATWCPSGPAPASADLGRLLQPRHHPSRRPARHPVRLPSPSSTPPKRSTGSTTTTRR